MDARAPQVSFYYRFNRFLERHLPQGLYPRSLIILIAPVVLLQTIMAGIILDRHWDNVTKVLGRSLAQEIGLMMDLYNASDKSEQALQNIETAVARRLRLKLDIRRGEELPPPIDRTFYSLIDDKMTKYLERETGRPFWINSSGENGQFEIRVEAEKGLIFRILTNEERAYAAGTYSLLLLMLLSSLLLVLVAVIFLRNQIRPIVDLARAAKAFGLGRDDSSYRPRGAAEVQQAGQAFLDMKRRIARHVEQRTAMLAGVSHDLRTILTRFKLELAFLGNSPRVKPLQEDVNEMQSMLEGYLAFVRGDEGERAVPTDVAQLVQSVAAGANRVTPVVKEGALPQINVRLKPNAFRRLLTNVVGNATRYGTAVEITGEVRDERLWLYVDDNGPGIAADKREDAFRPFVRLDEARNLNETGSGLGLAIALDIAQSHGGDMMLEDSPLGGLRVAIKVPV